MKRFHNNLHQTSENSLVKTKIKFHLMLKYSVWFVGHQIVIEIFTPWSSVQFKTGIFFTLMVSNVQPPTEEKISMYIYNVSA